MKLEKQVVSLELAQKLKELGVKQDGYFCYYAWGVLDTFDNANKMMCGMLDRKNPNGRYSYTSAFTVAELGEMLKENYVNWADYHLDKWYWVDTNGNEIIADTEADIRAKMLIYLIENNLVKV